MVTSPSGSDCLVTNRVSSEMCDVEHSVETNDGIILNSTENQALKFVAWLAECNTIVRL